MAWRVSFFSILAAIVIGAIPAQAQPVEKRIALVIGNANYQAGALPTPANDAGLIAQTLQAAGFDVVGARDLEQDSLRRAFRDFVDKAESSGPDTVAFIYLSGYGLQLEGENYFAPIDARITRDTDVAAEALRLSDYTRPLAALHVKAGIVVLDGARANPFARTGSPLAGGLALVEPEPGLLIAFNATPGTIGPEAPGPYSPYAQALAEMIRDPGLPLNDVFERVRLRVNETTQGAEVPWDASKIEAPVMFFERGPDAPPPPPDQTAAMRSRPLRDLGGQDAYLEAVARDTLRDYEDFLAAYPDNPMAARVRALLAARREALTWRRTRMIDTPPAYWSYLRRYPRGAHADDARRRLAYLAAAFEPPPGFAPVVYDVPPPPPDEILYIERPVLMFDDPGFGFAPPPPPPLLFLPLRPAFMIEPPPPPEFAYILPAPIYAPVPIWVRPPLMVAPPPPNNVIFNNIHNTVVINNTTNMVTITPPGGRAQTVSPAQAVAPAQIQAAAPLGRNGSPAPILLGPALPPSIATKAALAPNPPPAAGPRPVQLPNQLPNRLPNQMPVINQRPGQPPGVPSQAQTTLPQSGQALPGAHGQPLPTVNGKPPLPGRPPAPSAPTLKPPFPRPATTGQATPPGAVGHPTPPAAAVHPPAAVVTRPPPAAVRAPPPVIHPAPPPRAVVRQPPPPVVRQPTPAAIARPAPPPRPPAPKPAPAAAKCVLPNGQPCPKR